MNQVCLFGYFLLFHVFFIWFLDVNNDGAKKRQSKFMLLIQFISSNRHFFFQTKFIWSNRRFCSNWRLFNQIDIYSSNEFFLIKSIFILSDRKLLIQVNIYFFESKFIWSNYDQIDIYFINLNLFHHVKIYFIQIENYLIKSKFNFFKNANLWGLEF